MKENYLLNYKQIYDEVDGFVELYLYDYHTWLSQR